MPGERLSGSFAESYAASADLSTHQYKLVKLTTTGVDLCGAQSATEVPIGILQNDPETGEAATVMHEGLSSLKVNAASPTIAAGDMITSGALGFGVKATSDKAQTVGRAIDAATADGVIISVLLFGSGQAGV
jgi:Uncharacterized conserved protein (DUF2190)